MRVMTSFGDSTVGILCICVRV